MEAKHRKRDSSWIAAGSPLAEDHPLSPLASTWLPPLTLQREFWVSQGWFLLILLLLLMTAHNQREEPLDYLSCRSASWAVGVYVTTASSVFRALKNPPESVLRHQLGEVASSVSQQMPTSKVRARLVKDPHLPLKAGNRLLCQGTHEGEGHCERGRIATVPRASADSSRSEYAATADAEVAASGLTGVVSETHFTLANSRRPGEQVPPSSRGIFGDAGFADVPVGQSVNDVAGDRVLGRKSGNPTVNNEGGDTVGEQVLRRQLRAGEPQVPWGLEETGLLLWEKLFSNVFMLRSGMIINAGAFPEFTLYDKVSGGEKGGGATEQRQTTHGLLIGLLSCFVGSFCGSLGDNMVRRSFVVLKEKDRITFFQMWRSPLWSIGMFLTTVVNTICSMIGLAFAPATVVTSFAGVHIFWNTLLAKTLNREKATVFDYVGIVSVVLGIVLIVVFSGGDQAINSAQAFLSHLAYPGPVVYILSVVILIILGSALDCCPNALPCGNLSTNMDGNSGGGARGAERFLLSVTSGACGGLSNLLAKATILVFDRMPHTIPDAQSAQGAPASVWQLRQKYTHLGWGACLLVTLTGGVAVAQLLFLNASLRKFEAIYVVPIINSVLIVMGALGGIILFHEVPAQFAPFTLGVVSVVVGVIALSYGKYEAEQYLLQESQRKETALRNIGGREPGDPLLQRDCPPEVSPEERRRGGTYDAHVSEVQGWFDRLFQPLTDASVNILVRTNTLNSNYPVGLLNMAPHNSNASIRLFHQTTFDASDATGGPDNLR